MTRWDTFTFRINPEERKMISVLAEKLMRSQSDAVRFVVFRAVRQIEADEQQKAIRAIPKQSKPVLQEVSNG